MQFPDILNEFVEEKVAVAVAEMTLQYESLKNELVNKVFLESHNSLKTSLKYSLLCASKDDREFLLKITPRSLCEEFKKLSPMAFLLVTKGLLGFHNVDEIFDHPHVLNNVAFLFSTASKLIDRKATSYGYLVTNALRDGGLREDTIKILPMCIHPRTSQIYDKNILSKNWKKPLEEALEQEKQHFK